MSPIRGRAVRDYLHLSLYRFHSLTLHESTKFLAFSKLKALADYGSNVVDYGITVAKMMICLFHRAENIVEKGEIAFSPFPTMFSKGLVLRGV